MRVQNAFGENVLYSTVQNAVHKIHREHATRRRILKYQVLSACISVCCSTELYRAGLTFISHEYVGVVCEATLLDSTAVGVLPRQL